MNKVFSVCLGLLLIAAFSYASTVQVEIKKEAEATSGIPVLGKGAGGPDAYGYKWIDSDEAGGPAYSWVDITATGTALGLSDDGEANITSPFPFEFYGVSSTDLRVSNNGGILYNVTAGDLWAGNAALPTTSARLQMILPFWDDIDSDSGNVYWEVQGSAPNRQLIVEWYDRPHYSNIGKATFELILYEGTNDIKFQYADLNFDNAVYDYGASATVGIQGDSVAANNWYLQYSYNTASLHDGLAIMLSSNPAPVSLDSLYFKAYNGTALMGAGKVASPVPADRTDMAFQYSQTVPCMDPWGNYVYEVYNANLRRFRVDDGTYEDYGLSHSNDWVCGTDGNYIYVPKADSVHKYTMQGAYVNTTLLDIASDPYSFGVVNDTVWASPDRYSHVFYAYPADQFNGGSLTHLTTWDVGAGTYGTGNIAFDGTYYYIPWIGTSNITFKRFTRNRALLSDGLVSIAPRSVMCRVAPAPSIVSPDSFYFKNYGVTDVLYGCPKSEAPNPAPQNCRPSFSFLDGQDRVGMDPQGAYIYEVNGSGLRRHSVEDGSYNDYTLSYAGNSACRTDGIYLYVPAGAVVYKYTLAGEYVNETTINITPNQWNFSLANDTIWCGSSSTLNGYALSRFLGGAISEDATWDVGSGSSSPGFVAWDGTNYYIGWSGSSSNTFKQFNGNRVLVSSGTVNLDPRGLMCRVNPPLGVTGNQSSMRVGRLVLMPNYPNPVRSQTAISFSLPRDGDYSFRVYNIAGQLVHSEGGRGQAGQNRLSWNSGRLAAGVYLYQVSSNGESATRKLVVVK